jgi:alpha-1,3-rhamnosyl/mannosyltransferase
MRVGLGVSLLGEGLAAGATLDGIGVYSQQLLSGLRRCEVAVTPYTFRGLRRVPPAEGFVAVPGHFLPDALSAAILRRPFRASGWLAREVDLFHATDHRIPKLLHTPVVATLMDPIPLMRPEWASPWGRGAKNWLFRSSARWADRCIAISHAVVDDLVAHFGIPRGRITVIPLGVDDAFFLPIAEAERRRTLEEVGLRPGFFLFIGTLQPRKNVERLLDAFLSLPQGLRREHPLVVVGRIGWGADALLERLRSLQGQGEVFWLGYVPAGRKRVLLRSALALVFPSLYEGFGLPVLEAFASGAPVITSAASALPEVAGDAALLVDPYDTEAIASAMGRLAAHPGLRQELAARGEARARRFTWAECARRTIGVYRELLS